jgi:hypothetical protein
MAKKYRKIEASNDTYRQSFYPRTIKQWNKLPSDISAASTLEGFKTMLDRLPAGHAKPTTYTILIF